MQIEKKMKEIILSEFEIVINKVKEHKEFESQLFYISALHGVIRRVMNIDYNDEFLYLHHVLQSTHGAFANRFHEMKSNLNQPIKITEKMVEKLFELNEELYKKIENDEDIDSTLKEMIKLSYLTTGNGYYLHDKGIIKI